MKPIFVIEKNQDDIMVNPEKAYAVASKLARTDDTVIDMMAASVCESFLDDVVGVCLPDDMAKGIAMLTYRSEAIRFYFALKIHSQIGRRWRSKSFW